MSRHVVEQSEKKTFLRLASDLLTDFTCLFEYKADRDFLTINNRVQAEGISFLTKTLPAFGISFRESIDVGRYRPPLGFKTDRAGRPLFLKGLLKHVFDFNEKDLPLLAMPDIGAVELIHQITAFFAKVEIQYTDAQLRNATEKYKALEVKYPDQLNWSDDRASKVLDNAHCILAEVLDGIDLIDIIPRHGPGAVAVKERYAEKFIFFADDRLNDLYPFADFFQTKGTRRLQNDDVSVAVASAKVKSRRRVRHDETRDCGPARLCFVPKTAKGPREIQAEPKERQWIQQGQGAELQNFLQSARSSYAQGHVNFERQDINASLALKGSVDGYWATIDWSNASRLIGVELCKRLLPDHVIGPLLASRTCYVELPDGEILSLREFAGMGSAVCFPVESVMFFALTVGTIAAVTGWPFHRCAKSVYVYGDDVIVPRRFAVAVMEVGQAIGMEPSWHKCYWRSSGPSFRESCGCDAFGGKDITPVRLRKLQPVKPLDAQKIASWVAMGNHLHAKGYWRTAATVFKVVGRATSGIPIVPRSSGQFGHHTFSYGGECYHLSSRKRRRVLRYNRDLQRFDYKSKGFIQSTTSDPLGINGFLLQGLCSRPPEHKFGDDYTREFPREIVSTVGVGEWQQRGAVKLGWKHKPINMA